MCFSHRWIFMFHFWNSITCCRAPPPPPPPPPQDKFSQKTPDGLGWYCRGLSVRLPWSPLCVDMLYSITREPGVPVQTEGFLCWLLRKSEAILSSPSITSFNILTISGAGKSCFMTEGPVFLSLENDEGLQSDGAHTAYSDLSTVCCNSECNSWIRKLDGPIIVVTFSGITSSLRISREIVKLNFAEVQSW